MIATYKNRLIAIGGWVFFGVGLLSGAFGEAEYLFHSLSILWGGAVLLALARIADAIDRRS